jgi:hypothetical protein
MPASTFAQSRRGPSTAKNRCSELGGLDQIGAAADFPELIRTRSGHPTARLFQCHLLALWASAIGSFIRDRSLITEGTFRPTSALDHRRARLTWLDGDEAWCNFAPPEFEVPGR